MSFEYGEDHFPDSQIWRLCFLILQQCAESIEATFPQRAALFDPALGDGEAFWLDPTSAYATDLGSPNQTATFEDLDMLNDCG